MGIYQRENGKWYAKITRNGKTIRRSLETTSEKEAMGRFELIKEQLFKQLLTPKPSISLLKDNEWKEEKLDFSRPTLSQAFQEYIDSNILMGLADRQ